MNETPFPTQTTVPPSLPAPHPRDARARGESPLRASLTACSAEGLAAEIVGACFGSAVVTAWGVELGASPLLLGALWGLPYFGQVLQLPASWVTSRFGRKTVAVVAHAVARQITLPIAVLPFVDVPVVTKRGVLVALFALSSILSVVGHNAWLAWMGDLVPARVRGSYFGRRAAMCAVVATVASFGVASALDAGRARASLGGVLAVILVVRSLSGVATTVLMIRQHDPPCEGATPPTLRDLALPVVDPVYRKILAYRAVWGIATGLTASVSAVYVLHALGIGFVGLAAYSAIIAVLRVLTTPVWGRALDRAGARPVLVVCSLGAAAGSLSWLGATAGFAWVIAIDALVSGLLVGGQELAVFTLPLASAPRAWRPLFAATSVMIGGVAFGLSALAGGALSATFSLQVLVTVSAALRVAAAALAARLEDPSPRRSSRTEPQGGPLDEGQVFATEPAVAAAPLRDSSP